MNLLLEPYLHFHVFSFQVSKTNRRVLFRVEVPEGQKDQENGGNPQASSSRARVCLLDQRLRRYVQSLY